MIALVGSHSGERTSGGVFDPYVVPLVRASYIAEREENLRAKMVVLVIRSIGRWDVVASVRVWGRASDNVRHGQSGGAPSTRARVFVANARSAKWSERQHGAECRARRPK